MACQIGIQFCQGLLDQFIPSAFIAAVSGSEKNTGSAIHAIHNAEHLKPASDSAAAQEESLWANKVAHDIMVEVKLTATRPS